MTLEAKGAQLVACKRSTQRRGASPTLERGEDVFSEFFGSVEVF